MIDGDEEFEEIWEMPINTSLKDLYPFVCLTNSGAWVRIQEWSYEYPLKSETIHIDL